MKIVLFGDYPALQKERAQVLLGPSFEVVAITDDAPSEAVVHAFAEAEVIVSNRYDAAMPPAPNCRLLQSPSAGIEQIDLSSVPEGVLVAVACGHEIPMAEYVCCAMLDDAIGMSVMPQAFRDGQWSQTAWIKGPRHGEVHGKSVGLVGYGGVGRHVAERATAFGMKVHALSRWSQGMPGPDSGPVQKAWQLDDWQPFLASLDYLVVTVPLSAATTGMIGQPWFDEAPSNLMVINVARGGVVDEAALFEALRDRKIRKAAIDVWYQYPGSESDYVFPSRFPFHTLDNVVMTPHASGRTEGTFDRRWQGICDNINWVHRGKRPKGVANG